MISLNLYFMYAIDGQARVSDHMFNIIALLLTCFAVGMGITNIINAREKHNMEKENLREEASVVTAWLEAAQNMKSFHVGDFVEVMESFESDSADAVDLRKGLVLMVTQVEDDDIRVNTTDAMFGSAQW